MSPSPHLTGPPSSMSATRMLQAVSRRRIALISVYNHVHACPPHRSRKARGGLGGRCRREPVTFADGTPVPCTLPEADNDVVRRSWHPDLGFASCSRPLERDPAPNTRQRRQAEPPASFPLLWQESACPYAARTRQSGPPYMMHRPQAPAWRRAAGRPQVLVRCGRPVGGPHPEALPGHRGGVWCEAVRGHAV